MLLELAAITLFAPRDPDTLQWPESPMPIVTQQAAPRAALGDGGIGAPILTPFITDIHTMAPDPEGGEYGIWGAGDDYKASFHDGMTFVPYLGADYPDNQPFAWRTTSVAVGGLELVTRAQPVTRQSARRYEYDHGGVVEAYDLRVDGLEQTFVIPERPAQAGDLVVRGRIDTELQANAVEGRHFAVDFSDREGQRILSYGAAIAVDALGRGHPMSTSYRDGAFTLTLDAEWLRSAAYPVVVDPLIRNIVLKSASTAPFTSDILWNGQRADLRVWVCYARAASASDQDMWIMRTNEDLPGVLFVQMFADITASWGIESCQLAFTPPSQRAVCAFVRDFGTRRNVRWHAHHIDDLSSRTGYGTFLSTDNNWRVDIGGLEDRAGQHRVMVVYQHENTSPFLNTSTSETHAFYVDFFNVGATTAQGNLTTPFIVRANPNLDYERPSINQVAEAAAVPRWAVAHQVYDNTIAGDVWDVETIVVNQNGAFMGIRTVDTLGNRHKLGPKIAGMRGRYLMVYATALTSLINFKTGLASGYELNTVRLDHSGSTLTQAHPVNRYLTSPTRVLEAGAVAYNSHTASHWMANVRVGSRIFLDHYGYRGGVVNSWVLVTGNSGTSEYLGGVAHDRVNDTFLGTGGVSPGTLRGGVFAYTTPGARSWGGTGCASSSPDWHGGQQIGDEFGTVQINGVPAGTPCFLVLSLNTANQNLTGTPGVTPGCYLNIDLGAGYLGMAGMQIAGIFQAAAWRIPLPEFLNPDTIYFQVFMVDLRTNLFLTTPRLAVPIVK